MKTCTRCNRILPTEAFQNGKRQDPHCHDCRLQTKAAHRHKYPHLREADRIVRSHVYTDPNAYAYNVAKHISTYLGDRIERWERRGKEAHPYLTTIKDLADKLAAQALTDAATTNALPTRQCDWCSQEFQPINKRQRYCTPKHSQNARDHAAVITGRNRERMRRRTQSG